MKPIYRYLKIILLFILIVSLNSCYVIWDRRGHDGGNRGKREPQKQEEHKENKEHKSDKH